MRDTVAGHADDATLARVYAENVRWIEPSGAVLDGRGEDLLDDPLRGEPLLRIAQVADQAAQGLFFLQFAQAGGVGGGDVDGDVVRQRVHALQAEQVIGHGRLVRRVLVAADVDAK